jgi:hypothetical protein
MNALLLTGWCGPLFAEMASITQPLMERYADRHGMDFRSVNLHDPGIPPSWVKIPRIVSALRSSRCDAVVWLDADVVVFDSSESILVGVAADSWQALVEHDTECGQVPNCGVWVVTKAMLPALDEAWMCRDRILHNPWWEQSAIATFMGYEVTFPHDPHCTLKAPLELHDRTTFLPAKWNHHPHDARRVEPPAFYHITSYPDRLATAIERASRAT